MAAATITPNSDIAPDGTTTADTANFSATTATNQQGMLFRNALTATIGQVVTFSVYMRVPSGTATVFIGLSEGIPLSGQSVACNVTTTWQRFSITRTAVAATQIYPEIGPDTRSFAGQPAVQPAASVFLWGAQVERHSSARAYIPTTTAVVYGPRFDHDPVTLACKGLLIEEGRTNLLARSQEFNLSPWATNNAMTVTPDATIAPDGTLTADAINFDTNSGSRIIYITGSAVVHTFSVWLRADTNRTCIIATAANLSTQIEVVANVTTTWQRFSVVASNWSSSTSSFNVRIANNATGTSGTIFAWGAQLEAGSFPTSYIPTTTGTLARSADVCSITGGNFTSFYNQSEGTLFADATPQTVDQVVVVVGANTSASTASHFIYKSNNLINAAGKRWTAQTVSTGAQTAIATTTDVAVSRARLAYAFKLNDFAFAYAGSIVGTDNSGTIPTPTAMRIGSRDDGLQINGHLAAVRYYKKRLPNAKLAQLTA